jgi:hypothetical protein
VLDFKQPSSFSAERDWICSFIFGEILGLPLRISNETSSDYTIHHANRKLTIPDVFFSSASSNWLELESLPELPLACWSVSTSGLDVNLVDDVVPVLFGAPGFYLDEIGNGYLNLDIFGSVFFMLSRYEETVQSERDQHDRFPAIASIAQKANFLNRPIVDEYVGILFSAMTRIWPRLKRKEKQGKVLITCDVDVPYDDTLKTLPCIAKRVAGDLLKRHSWPKAFKTLNNALAQRRGNWSHDPNNTFDWIMDANEAVNSQVTFFFVSGRSSIYDVSYNLDEPFIKNLLLKIDQREHQIAMHGSYNAVCDSVQLRTENILLQQTCAQAGINQDISSNRQHYLRWDSKKTPSCLEAAGLRYDSTGSFADAPGFRYGTAHSFQMWDWGECCALKISQLPLIVMEVSAMDDLYLGLGHTGEAIDLMLTLKQRAMQFGGNFTLLWHNSNFTTEKDREFYLALIQ